MSDDHNANETSEEKSSIPVNRRRFVKGAGAGIFGTSMIGFAGVGQAAETDVEMNELSRTDAREMVETVRRTSDFEALRTHFHDEYGMEPVLSEASTYEMTGERVNEGGAIEIVDVSVECLETKQEEGIVEREASMAFGFQNGALAKSKGTIVDDYASGSIGVTTLNVTGEGVETDRMVRDPDSEQDERMSPQISKCGACKEIVDFVCANACWLGAAGICVAVAFISGPGATACAFIAKVVCDAYGDSVSRICYRYTGTVCSDLGFC